MRSAVYPEGNRRGFSLIELLVVISIASTLTVLGFVNFKDFSAEQVSNKAVGEIQTFLRLAQSNATTSTICKKSDGTSEGGATWSLVFRVNKTTIDLVCGSTNAIQKTYVLENATVDTIVGSACDGSSTIPLTLTYSSGSGALTFSSPLASPSCLASENWTFTIKNTLNTNKTKLLKISKGGAINVQ